MYKKRYGRSSDDQWSWNSRMRFFRFNFYFNRHFKANAIKRSSTYIALKMLKMKISVGNVEERAAQNWWDKVGTLNAVERKCTCCISNCYDKCQFRRFNDSALEKISTACALRGFLSQPNCILKVIKKGLVCECDFILAVLCINGRTQTNNCSTQTVEAFI